MKLPYSVGIPLDEERNMATRIRRKRKRPSSWDCRGPSGKSLVIIFLCGLTLNQPESSAFSPLPQSTSRGESHLCMIAASSEITSEKRRVHVHKEDDFFEKLLSSGDDKEDRKKATINNGQRSSTLPPWLQRYYDEYQLEDSPFPIQQLQDLEALLTKNGFSSNDNQDILQTMLFYYSSSAARSDTSAGAASLLRGMIDFVNLIVAEHSHFQSFDDEDNCKTTTPMHCDVFASKPVILAGVVHFAESMAARQNGIYDRLRFALQGSNTFGSWTKPFPPGLPPAEPTSSDGFSSPRQPSRYPPNLPMAAQKIAASAATIQRTEVLARTILGVGNTRRLTKAEAEGLQGLLLSSMDDWRALALRCIASLFRLEGILHQQDKQQSLNEDEFTVKPLLPGLRSPEVVHTAQKAILVYATLAQRLGMHQLKAKIEEKAFQILYQRQFKAVSSVYQQNHNAMAIIRSHLSTQIDSLLRSDDSLMTHIETLEVSSRVKEPYSFWKKLLKAKSKQKRKQRQTLALPASQSASPTGSEGEGENKTTTDLSFVQVKDGIALRVILKAKKESPDEPDETTRAREKFLCYYVQHLIRKQWPGDEDRVKDYIQYPKPNGYQSLHYTAWLTYWTGQHFPFEVQVRSEEMHRIAEYGVAAHWDYKLASSSSVSNDKQSGAQSKPAFALKAADSTKEDENKLSDGAIVDVIPDESGPEVVVDPTSFSVDNVMKASRPTPNGNTHSPVPPATSESYIDALVTARQNLVKESVYVFVAGSSSLTMEQGQLLILDSGSSIRDALEYMKEKTPEILRSPVEESVMEVSGNVSTRPMESGFEFLEPSVWRNGQHARMNDIIRNGDVLLLEL